MRYEQRYAKNFLILGWTETTIEILARATDFDQAEAEAERIAREGIFATTVLPLPGKIYDFPGKD